MKNISFLVFVVMTFFLVACGNEKKESSTQRFSSSYSSAEALINAQQPLIEVGGTTYQISQQSYQVINQAVYMAQQQGIQPVMLNGASKYRANVTAALEVSGAYQGGYNQQSGYQGGYQQPTASNILNITQAVIHR